MIFDCTWNDSPIDVNLISNSVIFDMIWYQWSEQININIKSYEKKYQDQDQYQILEKKKINIKKISKKYQIISNEKKNISNYIKFIYQKKKKLQKWINNKFIEQKKWTIAITTIINFYSWTTTITTCSWNITITTIINSYSWTIIIIKKKKKNEIKFIFVYYLSTKTIH